MFFSLCFLYDALDHKTLRFTLHGLCTSGFVHQATRPPFLKDHFLLLDTYMASVLMTPNFSYQFPHLTCRGRPEKSGEKESFHRTLCSPVKN